MYFRNFFMKNVLLSPRHVALLVLQIDEPKSDQIYLLNES